MIFASYDLPDDVFVPGEVKPTRPKKKVVTKKRNLDASGTEVEFLLVSLCYLRRQRGDKALVNGSATDTWFSRCRLLLTK